MQRSVYLPHVILSLRGGAALGDTVHSGTPCTDLRPQGGFIGLVCVEKRFSTVEVKRDNVLQGFLEGNGGAQYRHSKTCPDTYVLK